MLKKAARGTKKTFDFDLQGAMQCEKLSNYTGAFEPHIQLLIMMKQ